MSRVSPAALLSLGQALKQSHYQHTTITPASHARVNARPQNAWAQNIQGILGWSRPFKREVIAPHIFELMQGAGILEPVAGGWRSTLRASTLGSQLYFHSAWPTEAENSVFFGPDTYRYVRELHRHLDDLECPVQRVVDIGCGAGVGAIELARRLPEAEVFAADINDDALHLSQVNAALAGVTLHCVKSDLLSAIPGHFDLIVSNPPYMVDAGERAYRCGGGNLGTGLSIAIVEQAMQRLAKDGSLLLYTGVPVIEGRDLLHEAVSPLLADRCLWQYDEIDPDVFGEELESEQYAEVDRIAVVLLRAFAQT